MVKLQKKDFDTVFLRLYEMMQNHVTAPLGDSFICNYHYFKYIRFVNSEIATAKNKNVISLMLKIRSEKKMLKWVRYSLVDGIQIGSTEFSFWNIYTRFKFSTSIQLYKFNTQIQFPYYITHQSDHSTVPRQHIIW